MRKFLSLLLCCTLLIPSGIFAMGPTRTAQCAWAPKKYNCSDEEKRQARKWFIAIPVALAVAALAAIGIKASSDAVKEAKQEQAVLDAKEATLKNEYDKLRLKKDNLQRQLKESSSEGETSLVQALLAPVEERMQEIADELAVLRRR